MELQEIRRELNDYFLERREEIDIALTALIANEHCIFLGNPGVAKSQLIRAIASHINANYFEKLITRFSTEDELFGPLSIKELKENDRFVRKTENYLPNAEIAFLDEIFKANSSILNALLSIMNERIYHNGDVIQKVPLISLFGASNELPEENELLAFYDRFLFRKKVDRIKSMLNLEKLIDLNENYKPKTTMDIDEIKKLREKIEKVDISNIKRYLIDIKMTLENEGIYISDRRFKKSVKAVKAYAFLNGKDNADENDLDILRHIYWDEPNEFYKVSITIFKISNHFSGFALEQREILDALMGELKKINKDRLPLGGIEYRKVLEILGKINSIAITLKDVKRKAEENGKPSEFVEEVLKEAEGLKNYVEGLLKN
ncbi:AAA family ATPase [Methanotorris igneus]|uniref:ATPase associated with various cellular activities AAA_5 n=1 Tax=Methanotorris igneus (strain DSM 5666 / JCM 11834 / Kol 5) TaxID=880724 RepID=F6BBK3_METIK|nr:AAA family ATPase [Methanotorris igneus]AEF96012.1 ATPase associated with various cellular activities AAA_5 [Methanotorris igneus Kol 5]